MLTQSKPSGTRRAFWGLAKFFGCLVLLIGAVTIGWLLINAQSAMSSLSVFLNGEANDVLLLWRLGIYTSLVLFWPQIIDWMDRRYALGEEEVAIMKSFQWHVPTIAVLFEVLVNQDGAAWLYQQFSGL